MSSDPDVPTTVVNLSGVVLSEAKINLLLKGLSFCPITRHLRKEEILEDLQKFFIRFRLKEFFTEKEEEEEGEAQSLFCPLSALMSTKRRNTALETDIKQTRIDMEHQVEKLQD